jgi:hypothetical protein
MARMQYKLNNDIKTKPILFDWLSAEKSTCAKTKNEVDAIKESR